MRLTKRLLAAMEEALIFRSAGELGSEAQSEQDYDDALSWVIEQQRKRERPDGGEAVPSQTDGEGSGDRSQ